MRFFGGSKKADAKNNAEETADRKYESMLGHYESRYGKTKGFAEARESIAYAIANEVFSDTPYIAARNYYNAAKTALDSGCKELSQELVDRAEGAFDRWKTLFPDHVAPSGYFIKKQIADLKNALRG